MTDNGQLTMDSNIVDLSKLTAEDLLEEIQKFPGAGKIYKKRESTHYHITSVRDLELIIKHLDNYRLHTKK